MSTIKIVPLGGVRENGKNMYVAEVEDEILYWIVDYNIQRTNFRIDVVIPDFTYLEENSERIAGSFNTWPCRCNWGLTVFAFKNSSACFWDRIND